MKAAAVQQLPGAGRVNSFKIQSSSLVRPNYQTVDYVALRLSCGCILVRWFLSLFVVVLPSVVGSGCFRLLFVWG